VKSSARRGSGCCRSGFLILTAPGFTAEYRRQIRLVAETYRPGDEDADLVDFIERAFDDIPER
jgi:hypothetical protein